MPTQSRRSGQRRRSIGGVALLVVGLISLAAAPLSASATTSPPAIGPITRVGGASVFAGQPDRLATTTIDGSSGTDEPKTGPVPESRTTFRNDDLGFSVSWEAGIWAPQRNHVPPEGAIAGVLLVNTYGGLLYIDAIPAGTLTDAAACVASNQTLIEGFDRITNVSPLEDADGAVIGDESGDPASMISTLEIDGEQSYLYVACASIDGGAAFLAFTYYLTQGDGLDADAFIAGWLPDVQAVVDSLERT